MSVLKLYIDFLKFASTVVLALSASTSIGQNYKLPLGEYMDTTVLVGSKCSPDGFVYYYQLKAKYPVSTERLLLDGQTFLKSKNGKHDGEGYITFRFIVDCEGNISRTKVMQTNENYKPIHFSREFVNDLYQFVRAMREWPVNIEAYNIKNINYLAFVSFKIKDGKVINIIP